MPLVAAAVHSLLLLAFYFYKNVQFIKLHFFFASVVFCPINVITTLRVVLTHFTDEKSESQTKIQQKSFGNSLPPFHAKFFK